MRAKEILGESRVEDNLIADTNTLIATLMGQGKEEISTQSLVDQLVSMGHNVNIHSVMGVLSQCPFIDNANPTILSLRRRDDSIDGDREEDDVNNSQEHISKMADKEVQSKF